MGMASTPRHPIWIHMMRFIQAEMAYLKGKPSKLPQYRILRTTGPHGLGVALMSWKKPYQDLRMAMFCRFGSLFTMNSTAVWANPAWKSKKRSAEGANVSSLEKQLAFPVDETAR